ncbi:hypothetical protein QBZ16_004027 [Prototheca wickerhamii]|uniref:MIR domain-containing protein n=1 Tax=Prototheca wickerhamii TaxID=3111 RepID=A0AAD9IJ87_PROWI|nr:hypothetical protein QBZ16_004027 [Prototheca wickerhamii]
MSHTQPDVAQGQPIHSGDQIRLQHGTTGRWLHSHQFKSPLSNNQEVRRVAWGLKHKQTGYYMASNNQVYNRPIAGHKEVYAAKAKSAPAKWKAAEGVYIPVVAQESS